jgi:hypothetical protein
LHFALDHPLPKPGDVRVYALLDPMFKLIEVVSGGGVIHVEFS